MQTGWIISGIGHAALIFVLLFGGLFIGDRIPEPIAVSDVTMVTEEEYAALALPGGPPDTQTDAPEVTAPEASDAPEAPAEDSIPNLPDPTPVETPSEPDTSELEVPEIVPNAVIVDTAPVIPAAPSEFDGTTLEPDAVAAPAPRVAPVPQVETPEVETAPNVVEDTAPDPEALPEDQPEPETATAPEAASDRIVTEAEEEKTYAPASSKRPRTRPARPVRPIRCT